MALTKARLLKHDFPVHGFVGALFSSPTPSRQPLFETSDCKGSAGSVRCVLPEDYFKEDPCNFSWDVELARS